jgi:hypothetical protein
MAINTPTNNAFEAFLQKPRGDKLIRLHISRNTLIAFVISILIHALILFFVVPKIKFDQVKESPTFEVVLEQPKKAEIIEKPLPQEPIPERLPEPSIEQPKPPKVMTQKPSKNAKPPVFSVPDVLATNKRPTEALSQKESKPKEAPTDMMAAINAKRAEREAFEEDAARQNAEAAARERGPSEEEKRDANIKRNFQNGTNGIFEITSLSNTNATFSFLGWTSSLSNARREFFEVEAKPGQDVRLVMIRRMISLIREHYQGDFDWESHRLGRTIVKSARLEDSAELEDFLMQEFFGRNYKTVL